MTFSPFRGRGFHLVENSINLPHCNWVDSGKYFITQAMKRGSLRKAEARVNKYYGLMGNGHTPMKIELFYDSPKGLLEYIEMQYVGGQMQITLGIDMVDFFVPDRILHYNMDRVFAHEMVHALMFTDVPNYTGFDGCPLWFIEGQAELIHGANQRLKNDLRTRHPYELLQYLDVTSYSEPGAALVYSAGYVAVRYLHEIMKPVGIKAIIAELKTGKTFNEALSATTSWTQHTSFKDSFKEQFGTGQNYINEMILRGDIDHADTGAIGGYLVDGGPVLINENVMDY